MRALKNVKEVELMGMPKLKKCVLMGGLKNVKSVKMENAGKFESVNGLKEVMEAERKRREEEVKKREEEKRRKEEERKRKEMEDRKRREEEERKRKEMEERRRREEEQRKRREEEERKKREEMIALAKTTVSVRNVEDLKNASCYVGVIVIASNCCNDNELCVLDLSRFVNLKELNVGDECFENVYEMKLIGLNELERVEIGENCFRKSFKKNPNRHFYLKKCERLRELKMGCYSFSDYSMCVIENVPSLEVIEMGELNKESGNFYYTSLELKSGCDGMK